MNKVTKDQDSTSAPLAPNGMLSAGRVDDNPLNEILHWAVGNLDSYVKFHNIKVTDEQKRNFLNNHEECHGCGAWFKNDEFSSFSLGCVLCENCDK